MNRTVLAAIFILPLMLIGCGSDPTSPQTVGNDATTALKKVGSIVLNITDEAGARAALADVQAGVAEFNQIVGRISTSAPINEKAAATLDVATAMLEFGEKFKALKDKNPAAAAILQPEIDKIATIK